MVQQQLMEILLNALVIPKRFERWGLLLEQTQSWQLFHVIGLLAKMVN